MRNDGNEANVDVVAFPGRLELLRQAGNYAESTMHHFLSTSGGLGMTVFLYRPLRRILS